MANRDFTYNDFIEYVHVSRETFLQLEKYILLLKKWQNSINLVSDATLDEVWTRHIVDSAQLYSSIKQDEKIVDIGSGAGLPGLILSVMGIKNITLVESDARKIAFLREAARLIGSDANVICRRIEDVDIREFAVITCRAFAPLERLLELLAKSLLYTHRLLLLKGKNYQAEIGNARQKWDFECRISSSITGSESAVLTITHVIKRS